MKTLWKNFALVVLILLVVSALFATFAEPFQQQETVSLSQVARDIEAGTVQKITVSGNELTIQYQEGGEKLATKETDAALTETLLNLGVTQQSLSELEIESKAETGIMTWLIPLSAILLPLLLFIVFFFMIFRQARAGLGQAFDFTKARARLFGAEGQKGKVTFKDVAGLKEAKEEVQEVVDFLKNPKKYLEMGAKIPRGVLLVGPPGTGKTLLARAVANEAGVPFFSASGSEFIEMFVGVGSSLTRDANVLVRTKERTRLMPIGEFVDQFYEEDKEGFTVNTQGTQTLGVDFARGTKFFKQSSWKNVQAVYRHKVDKIYEIEFVGGKIKTTGDHSVFIRNGNHIICKRTDELKPGDVLVGLPYGVKGGYNLSHPLGRRSTHLVKSHLFPKFVQPQELPVWQQFSLDQSTPRSVLNAKGLASESTTVLQHPETKPISLLQSYSVQVTPGLLKLLGYYTAEGLYRRRTRSLRFCFGSHEKQYHKDCARLMRESFGLTKPTFFNNNSYDRSALVICYGSTVVGEFFEKHCGNGAFNKHVPEFMWDLPKEYFVSYLDGLIAGDGYMNKRGMFEFSSVSKRLVDELRWLLNMHGIPCSVTKYAKSAGHRIKNGKPLPSSTYWRITVATKVNPLNADFDPAEATRFLKRPIIKKITPKTHNGYVYDLVGCDNEAFFAGEKPLLVHNSRVRSLFETAKKAGRSIVFIDELDAIGRQRGFGFGGGHDEREQTLNQILVEMDGFERDSEVIIAAATNRPDVLDPALLRPGRFDRRIILDLPDVNDREAILKVHSRGKPLAPNTDVREIAERTPGFAGADLENLVNEAAILAARRNKTQVFQEELLESIDKVLLGPERKSHVLSKKEKEITAFHEAGHALVAATVPHGDPVRKVSIISRGRAGGYTLKLPTEERHLKKRDEFLSELAVLLGGYVAEKLTFKDITTGASNDLEKASEIARRLVKEYGMSDKLGPVTFGEREEMMFLGRRSGESQNYSEKVAEEIDKEVSHVLLGARKTAEKILKQKKTTLEKIAKVLVEKETIERQEFEKLVGKKQKKKG